MKTRLHWIAAALALAAVNVHAQGTGHWMVRAGVTNINPQVSSGDLSAPSLPGTKIDVNDATSLSGGVTYLFDDHWAVDVPLGLPFKHNIVGDGAIAGVGKIGDVRALPVTVLGEYRFGAAAAKVRPFLGAGITYAKFYDERSTGTLSALTGGSPTTLSVDSRFGFTLEAGVDFAVNERWSIGARVNKTFLKTKATLSTGQTIDTKLDPMSLSLGVGYRF